MVLYDHLECADNALTAHLLVPEETPQFVEVTTMVVACDEDDVVTTILPRCAMSSENRHVSSLETTHNRQQSQYACNNDTKSTRGTWLHSQVVDVT